MADSSAPPETTFQGERLEPGPDTNNTGNDNTNGTTNLAKPDPNPPVPAPEPPVSKTSCKKHAAKKRDSKKHRKSSKNAFSSASEDDDSSDPASSSDSSDSDSGSESDASVTSSDSETEKKRRKQRARAKEKKAQKNGKKKSREARRQADSDSESDHDNDEREDGGLAAKKKGFGSGTTDPLKELRGRIMKNNKAAERHAKDFSSEDPPEDSDVADSEQVARKLAEEVASLKIKLAKERRINGRDKRGLQDDRNRERDRKGRSHKSSSKKKVASKVDFKRVDELWDKNIHNYKLSETVDDTGANEWEQYIFTVRRQFNWENKYTSTVVDIKSKPLREALAKIMDGVKGVSLVEETAVLDPNMLFLYLEESRRYVKDQKQLSKTEKKSKAKKAAATRAAHLKVLVKYLDTDYAETKKTLYPLLESNMITFEYLWALFKPNTIVYTPTYGNQDEPRAFKMEYATKEYSFMRGEWYCIEGRYMDYDGKSFGMGAMDVNVESFKGARKITSLACYPLKYHREAATLRTNLIERGKKFVALKGMNYRFHRGMAFFKKKRSVIKVNINGRIMIDPAIHRRINPNYPVSTVRPKDPDNLGSDDDDDDADCGCCAGSESDSDLEDWGRRDPDEPLYKYKVVRDEKGKPTRVPVEVDEDGNVIEAEKIDQVHDPANREFSEEELLITSPVVLGFAFSEKMWLEFSISGVRDIEWNEKAFASLVLPDNQKSIVKALVESHTFNAAHSIDDVIQGKGKGLVSVLHGPPGTGKTLTAEGIAELLKRPLYMVSVGELGLDSRTLETELNKILDIAHSWGAVLLLDEADIFLEKRTIQDIHRNALVSIFLRLLEYFQGILFLTTNRVETFDDAFQSRIHVALRYGELTPKAKRSVWKLFLERVREKEGLQIQDFTESDLDALSRHYLNGRQIKNSVRTAQALAVNEKTPLSMTHIKRVLDVAATFDQDLRGGTGYMDAMRSYT